MAKPRCQLTLRGLLSHTLYHFRVRARNRFGWGAYSNVSPLPFRTRFTFPPSAAQAPLMQSRGATTITVAASALASQGADGASPSLRGISSIAMLRAEASGFALPRMPLRCRRGAPAREGRRRREVSTPRQHTHFECEPAMPSAPGDGAQRARHFALSLAATVHRRNRTCRRAQVRCRMTRHIWSGVQAIQTARGWTLGRCRCRP